MQKVDVHAVGFIGEVGGNPYRKPLGMRRPRGAVGMQPGQLALALYQGGVGIEDVGKLAVQADADVVREFRVTVHDRPRRAHDELEMGDVVAVLRSEHEELVLRGGFAVQPVTAVKHEDLERRDAVFAREVVHLAEVRGFDRRHVIAVVDPEATLRQFQHFGHDLAVRTAAVEVVVPGADVVQAGSDAAHGGRLALAHRVLGQRPVDADMHVGIDAAGESQKLFGVEHLARVLGADFRREPRHLAVRDADVEAVHSRSVRAHHARILDHEIKSLHFGFSFLVSGSAGSRGRVTAAPKLARTPVRGRHSVCLAPAFPACRSTD